MSVLPRARVAELADALRSGRSKSNLVLVQLQSRALEGFGDFGGCY